VLAHTRSHPLRLLVTFAASRPVALVGPCLIFFHCTKRSLRWRQCADDRPAWVCKSQKSRLLGAHGAHLPEITDLWRLFIRARLWTMPGAFGDRRSRLEHCCLRLLQRHPSSTKHTRRQWEVCVISAQSRKDRRHGQAPVRPEGGKCRYGWPLHHGASARTTLYPCCCQFPPRTIRSGCSAFFALWSRSRSRYSATVTRRRVATPAGTYCIN
jgi:hypothetical protein